MEKKVIKKRIWIVEVLDYSDGTTALKRTNQGFAAFELLGILDLTRKDVLKQIRGTVKPDVVHREIVKEKTRIVTFLKNTDASVRLANFLKNNFEYIEDVKLNELRKMRGCGKKTINELTELLTKG